MSCMNCGADRVIRVEDEFTCSVCEFHWTVEDEQANAVYLRSQGREPAQSIKAVVEVTSEVTTTGNESGSGEPQKPTEPASTPEPSAEASDSKPEPSAKKSKG